MVVSKEHIYNNHTLCNLLRSYHGCSDSNYSSKSKFEDDIINYVENALNDYYQQGLVLGKLEEAISVRDDLKDKIKILKEEMGK